MSNTKDPMNINRTIKKFYKKFFAHKFHNVDIKLTNCSKDTIYKNVQRKKQTNPVYTSI